MQCAAFQVRLLRPKRDKREDSNEHGEISNAGPEQPQDEHGNGQDLQYGLRISEPFQALPTRKAKEGRAIGCSRTSGQIGEQQANNDNSRLNYIQPTGCPWLLDRTLFHDARAQRLCQLKKSRRASAEPRNSGMENKNPGEPAIGRMVPHFVQL